MNIQIEDYKEWSGEHDYLKNTDKFLSDISVNYDTGYDIGNNSQKQYRAALNAVVKNVIWEGETPNWPKNTKELEKRIKKNSASFILTDDKGECYSLLLKYVKVYRGGTAAGKSELLEILWDNYPAVSGSALYEEIEKSTVKVGEKDSLVKTRIGQGEFRRRLLKKYKDLGLGEKCILCGIEGGHHLIASHIKPWSTISKEVKSASDDKEKDELKEQLVSVDNGLLLCPGHDHLFDKENGYISFDPDNNGKIMISSLLTPTNVKLFNVDDTFELGRVVKLSPKMKKNLRYHNKEIFKP